MIKEYTNKGYWGHNTLLDYFDGCLKLYPDKTAVADSQGKRLTYRQLDSQSLRLANALKKIGIQPGQIATLQLPNCVEFTIIFIALLRLGAVINPISTNYQGDELKYVLNKCRSTMLFIPNKFRGSNYAEIARNVSPGCPNLQNIIMVGGGKIDGMLGFEDLVENELPLAVKEKYAANPNDVALVFFKSGTKSRPKGVLHTHNTIIFAGKTLSRVLGLSDSDSVLLPLTVARTTSCLHGVCLPIISGGKSVMLDVFSPKAALELIEREKCSYGMVATPFIEDMLCYPDFRKYDISSLRFLLCGMASIPRRLVHDAFVAGFKALGIYGSSEIPSLAVNRLTDNPEVIFSSIAAPLPGIEVLIVDNNRIPLPVLQKGQVAFRGPNVCVGYLDEPELTQKSFDDNGWFYSGYQCLMDSEGKLKIVNRSNRN